MARSHFDEQLRTLNQDMIGMGMLCERAIRESTQSMLTHNLALAGTLPDIQEQMNQMDREIESICLRLLLQQQPVASDLRYISSAMKIVTDMKRIVVQSADIGDIVKLDTIRSIPDGLPVTSMSESVITMVSNCIDAFVRRDVDLARRVIQSDDEVDDYFDRTKNRLIAELQKPDKTPGSSYGAMILDILMIAKYLERIGDHAVNIAGWVCYSVTGVREGPHIS